MRWYNARKRPPKPFVSVLAWCPNEKPLPTTHEAFMDDQGAWYAVGYGGWYKQNQGDVTYYAKMPTFPGTQAVKMRDRRELLAKMDMLRRKAILTGDLDAKAELGYMIRLAEDGPKGYKPAVVAMRMRYMDGMSWPDIAKEMGYATKTMQGIKRIGVDIIFETLESEGK